MKKPKFINLFIDYYDELALLSDEQVGKLIKALLLYADAGEQPDLGTDTALRVMFSAMRRQIDRDYEKYEAICRKRSESGRKGGAPLGNDNASKTTKTSKTSEEEDKEEDKYKNNSAPNAPQCRASSTVYIPQVHEVTDYLNSRAGTHYRASSVNTRTLIVRLLEQGYTVDDFKRVIDRKCGEWLDTEYAKYLRPDTLFGNKFECYLNTPAAPKKLPQNKRHPWQNGSQDAFAEAIRRYEDSYEVPIVENRDG